MTSRESAKARDERWYIMTLEGHTQREIAEMTDNSPSYVSQRIKRHRERFAGKKTAGAEHADLFKILASEDLVDNIRAVEFYLKNDGDPARVFGYIKRLFSPETAYLMRGGLESHITDLLFELTKKACEQYTPMKPREW